MVDGLCFINTITTTHSLINKATLESNSGVGPALPSPPFPCRALQHTKAVTGGVSPPLAAPQAPMPGQGASLGSSSMEDQALIGASAAGEGHSSTARQDILSKTTALTWQPQSFDVRRRPVRRQTSHIERGDVVRLFAAFLPSLASCTPGLDSALRLETIHPRSCH